MLKISIGSQILPSVTIEVIIKHSFPHVNNIWLVSNCSKKIKLFSDFSLHNNVHVNGEFVKVLFLLLQEESDIQICFFYHQRHKKGQIMY